MLKNQGTNFTKELKYHSSKLGIKIGSILQFQRYKKYVVYYLLNRLFIFKEVVNILGRRLLKLSIKGTSFKSGLSMKTAYSNILIYFNFNCNIFV